MDFAQFQRPQRYIGNEWNVIKKPHCRKISFCLCYPDLYEIGMSNLGVHIVYALINQYSNLVCERAFMPAADLADYLKAENKPLFSLETKTALNKFEVIGFHLGCELNFTNVLQMLALGCIPIKACERKTTIVIGGGIANPEPLAEFIDVFYLGEFEEVADSFVKVLQTHSSKESRLKALAELPGFYVPSFYNAAYSQAGYHLEAKYPWAQFPLQRRYVKDLDKVFVPDRWLTPHTQIIHDRIPIEIARGCPNRCAFCQARALYSPYRERKVKTIERILTTNYKSSGYQNFSFLALSASDYSQIEELIDLSFDYCQKNRIGLSLPSLRVSDIVGRLYHKLSGLKKISLTVAVEAARSSLRESLNKRIDTGVLFEAAQILKSLKAQHIKIYFMYGFPEESDEDLLAIGDFLKSLSRRSRLKLNVSINPFIPKPFAQLEASSMLTEQDLLKKQALIIRNLPRKGQVKVSFASVQRSIFEAIISSAGREFSKVIYRAFLQGACFDGDQEKFSWPLWQEAIAKEGIDCNRYLDRSNRNFPWSFIK